MQETLYNPFINFEFRVNTCFLTGEKLDESSAPLYIFPEWIMDAFELKEQPFKLLDETNTTYGKLSLPCSQKAKEKIELLQNQVAAAFENPTGLAQISEWTLFFWSGLISYGLIYKEVKHGLINQQRGEIFDLSPALVEKFKNLLFFLQGIIFEIDAEETKPFSLFILNVENDESLAPFEHRNEINTMTFLLRIKNKAILICLQDNGANKIYHQNLFKKINNQPITAKQLQEFCAKVFYSNYLFNQIMQYDFVVHEDKIYASALNGFFAKVPFDEWVNKTYAQVLEAFWKPWNYTLMDILKDPNKPISAFESEN